ncbi:MAG: type IV pili methyl-accepting chemotaxis transducer N-terminal domain-containing protein [Spirochaetes bacterium]|nr:type IV pili methyl-accepting chemotaxis transducer N-terminal domain-containing protein [Spirochaetota bacterium]
MKKIEKFKIPLLYSFLGIIILAIIICTFTLNLSQKNDGLHINLSGRQRMLTQKILKEILLFQDGKLSCSEMKILAQYEKE